MRQWVRSVWVLARERWSWVFGCVVLMFLLPEYCAPVLAVIALILAWRDIKAARGRGLIGDAGRWMWLYLPFMAISVVYSRRLSVCSPSSCGRSHFRFTSRSPR